MTDDRPDKEALFQLMPDLWYQISDHERIEYRCREGVWRWKIITDDGEVMGEGEGSP